MQPLATFLQHINTLLTTLGGTIFLIAVAIAGIMRMISGGNERRITISNMALMAAITGLAIILLAGAFNTFITNSIPH